MYHCLIADMLLRWMLVWAPVRHNKPLCNLSSRTLTRYEQHIYMTAECWKSFTSFLLLPWKCLWIYWKLSDCLLTWPDQINISFNKDDVLGYHADGHFCIPHKFPWPAFEYHQVSNIKRTLGNKIVDHSDVVGALPVSAAPTTSSFST